MSDLIRSYVLGFAISDFDKVLLMWKRRPETQRGKLNGIGGRVEPHETVDRAMIREFKERAGLEVMTWRCFAVVQDPASYVCCFVARKVPIHLAVAQTDEQLMVVGLGGLKRHSCVPDVAWLVHMALSSDERLRAIIYEEIYDF